jgi:hypothetical protein
MSAGEPPPPTAVIVQPSQGVVGVATGTIDALRTSPMLLVMVVLNCAFIAAGAYYLRNQQDHAYMLVNAVLERCLPEAKHSLLELPALAANPYPPSPLGTSP